MIDKTKKTTALATLPSEETLALLKSEFPQEEGFTRNFYPRLGMYSQDVTEGKGKAMKVVTEAGTFYTEKQTEEVDADGKKIWEREELGSEIEATIIFQRKQLRSYNSGTEEFTSSPAYDEATDVIKLFRNKQEIARGTPAELKALPEFEIVKDGKTKSSLEENRILYVLFNGEIYQMNLRGSSMFSFMTYARKSNPPASVTRLSSESKEKGEVAWNQMMFETVRPITAKEAETVIEELQNIKEGVAEERSFFASKSEAQKEADDAFDSIGK